MTYARLRPIRSPTLLLIRMKAADTSASSAIADCTPLAVVSRSSITAEIDTFISEVSTTRTNMAMARRIESFRLPEAAAKSLAAESVLMAFHRRYGELRRLESPAAGDHRPRILRCTEAR